MAELKTRAGLVPANADIPFAIRTEDAEDFIKAKFDFLTEALKKKYPNIQNLEIVVTSKDFSKSFVPFIIAISTNVLKPKSNSDDEELSIFKNADTAADLIPEYYQLLKTYMYDNADIEAFFPQTTRQSLGLSMSSVHELKASSKPKVYHLNRGQYEYVMAYIDPLRVFHDMLTDTDQPDQRFLVNVETIEKIKGGNFVYNVRRCTKFKKNKKHDVRIEDVIQYEFGRRLRH